MNDENLSKRKFEMRVIALLFTVYIFVEQTVTEKISNRLVSFIRKLKQTSVSVACFLQCVCVSQTQRNVIIKG